MVLQLLAESVSESGKAALLHSQGQVLAFNVASGNMPRVADYPRLGNPYYAGRRVAPRCLYRVAGGVMLFYSAKMAVEAERQVNRYRIGLEGIRRNLRD